MKASENGRRSHARPHVVLKDDTDQPLLLNVVHLLEDRLEQGRDAPPALLRVRGHDVVEERVDLGHRHFGVAVAPVPDHAVQGLGKVPLWTIN